MIKNSLYLSLFAIVVLCAAPVTAQEVVDETLPAEEAVADIVISEAGQTAAALEVEANQGSEILVEEVVEAIEDAVTDEESVLVVDEEAPVITLIGARNIALNVGAEYVELGATALDETDGDLTEDIAIFSSQVDTSTIGTYTVFYIVSDAANNRQVVERQVIIYEQEIETEVETETETETEIEAEEVEVVEESTSPLEPFSLEDEVDGDFDLAANFTPSTLAVGDVGEITVTLANDTNAAKDYVLYMFLEDEDENFTSNDHYYVDQSVAVDGTKSYTFQWLNNEEPGTYRMWAEVKNVDWSGDPKNTTCTCVHKQMVGEITVEASSTPQAVGESLYRFYSDTFKGHFYTTSFAESEGLKTDTNWLYEGEVTEQTVNASLLSETEQSNLSITPVYRFWSENFKHHFYTVSEIERQSLVDNDPNWEYEAVAYHAYKDRQMDTTAVHRFYSANYNGHFYTTSNDEKDFIEANDPNWAYEGIAWYMQK